MKIVLHVDRLVLEGIAQAPGEAERVRTALTRELTQLLRVQPPAALLRAAQNRPALGAPALDARDTRAPAPAGRAIARSVHRSLGG
jgi:hypothetical protein